MEAHLAEIGRRVSPGAHAVLVLDGAGWHSSPRPRVPDNVSLLPLPRYAPELNAANPTAPKGRHGPRRWIASALNRPLAFSRLKRVLGGALRSQSLEAQRAEAMLAVRALNRMAELGLPRARRVA